MATYTSNYNLGKPEATDPFGDFRQLFNDNMDEIDANLGGGGGGGGGGGANYGFAIDENNKLFEGSITDFNQSLSYTATEDAIALCYFRGGAGTWQFLSINGVYIRLYGDGTNQAVSYSVPIRKGDVVASRSESYSESCYFLLSVYGIKQGTNGIYAPVIYSDNERKIGVWRDNKPLYQKTWDISDLFISYNSWTISSIPIGDMETIVNVFAINQNGKAFWGDAMASIEVDPTYIGFQTGRNGNLNERYRYVTIQYTKTTDVAGSGNWNTDGVPTVHYSTNEQVIGTWVDGKPLYKRTWDFSGSPVMLSYADWVNSGISAGENIKEIMSAELKYGAVILANVEVGVNVDGYPVGFQKLDNLNTRGVSYCTLIYTKTTD